MPETSLVKTTDASLANITDDQKKQIVRDYLEKSVVLTKEVSGIISPFRNKESITFAFYDGDGAGYHVHAPFLTVEDARAVIPSSLSSCVRHPGAARSLCSERELPPNGR